MYPCHSFITETYKKEGEKEAQLCENQKAKPVWDGLVEFECN